MSSIFYFTQAAMQFLYSCAFLVVKKKSCDCKSTYNVTQIVLVFETRSIFAGSRNFRNFYSLVQSSTKQALLPPCKILQDTITKTAHIKVCRNVDWLLNACVQIQIKSRSTRFAFSREMRTFSCNCALFVHVVYCCAKRRVAMFHDRSRRLNCLRSDRWPICLYYTSTTTLCY